MPSAVIAVVNVTRPNGVMRPVPLLRIAQTLAWQTGAGLSVTFSCALMRRARGCVALAAD